jgi:hypothetical protein
MKAYISQAYIFRQACSSHMHTSHRCAPLTGVQLSQGMDITGFQILALTAKLTQTVPIALRSFGVLPKTGAKLSQAIHSVFPSYRTQRKGQDNMFST